MHKERENYLDFMEKCYNKFLTGDKKYGGKWKKESIIKEIKNLKEELYDSVIYLFFINEKIKRLENGTKKSRKRNK